MDAHRPTARRKISAFLLSALALTIAVTTARAQFDKTGSESPIPEEYEPLSLEVQFELAAARDEERAGKRKPGLRDETPAIEWIRVAYHGEVYDANLESIQFDVDVLGAMQESLFSILLETVDSDYWMQVQEELEEEETEEPPLVEALSLYEDNEYDGYDLLVYRQILLKRLVDVAPEFVKEGYGWRLKTLDSFLYREVAAIGWAIRADLMEYLERSWSLIPPGAKYIEACRAKGVPVPPDFPDKNRWVYQGVLGYTFISQGSTAEVYAYKDTSASTPGTCIALPRSDPKFKYSQGGDARLIGIICQSARKVGNVQHACFWDNVEQRYSGSRGRRLNGQSNPMTIGNVADGYSLAENCTECHRGENVFNIHPGTALDLNGPTGKGGPYQVGATWYKPIGHAYFTNPPAFALGASSAQRVQCEQCHSIGSTTPDPTPRKPKSYGYCDVIADAAHWTMPPHYLRDKTVKEGPAGWPVPKPPEKYKAHILKLVKECGSAVIDVQR